MYSKVTITSANVDLQVGRTNKNISKAIFSRRIGGGVVTKNNIQVVQALRDINLTIDQGERVGFIGHNGAGKTTLLRLIAGILEPASGVVEIKGELASLINIAVGIDAENSGAENAALKCTYRGVPESKIPGIVSEIEMFSELGEFYHLPVKTYSAGMRARLVFAIATALIPDILVLDEWIGAGDARFKKLATERMNDVAKQSDIIIFASHSEAILRAWATRIIWLDHGEIIDDGEPESILGQYFKSV